MDRLRFIILTAVVIVLLLDNSLVKAIEYPRTIVPDVITLQTTVNNDTTSVNVPSKPVKAVQARVISAMVIEQAYLPVPEENLNPIDYVIPDFIWKWQSKEILRWLPLVEQHTELDPILILALIAQESRGDASLDSYFNGIQDGVGLMQIVPKSWLGTKSQLLNPSYNIATGTSMLETILEQALEKGYRPGREATRAALAAYNCSWSSLEADRCYSFGGWLFADKILNYWYPLLQGD